MSIEDELRRLFADDRLDIAVHPGAEEVIVTGARRIRRRRFAVATAGAVAIVLLGSGVALAAVGGPVPPPVAQEPTVTAPTTAPPTTPTTPSRTSRAKKPKPPVTTVEPPSQGTRHSPSSPPPVSYDMLGPTSFGRLSLGMSEADALDTGLLGRVEATQDDTCRLYRARFDGVVVVSAQHGVVRIAVSSPVTTPEGVHTGATVADVRATYPDASDYRAGLKSGSYGFVVAGPGNRDATWPDTSVIDRIEIGMTSDCVGALQP